MVCTGRPRRRQQLDDQRHRVGADRRVPRQPEHLLQPHRDRRRRRAVVDRAAACRSAPSIAAGASRSSRCRAVAVRGARRAPPRGRAARGRRRGSCPASHGPSQSSSPASSPRPRSPAGPAAPCARSHSTRAAKPPGRRRPGQRVEAEVADPAGERGRHRARAGRRAKAGPRARSRRASAARGRRTAPVAARPVADGLAAKPAGVQRSGGPTLGHRQRQADRRLARVAVEVGGDQEAARRRAGSSGGQRRALAAGEQVARRAARPPLARCGRDRRATAPLRATRPGAAGTGAPARRSRRASSRIAPTRRGPLGRRSASEPRAQPRSAGAAPAAQRVARLDQRREVGGERRRPRAPAATSSMCPSRGCTGSAGERAAVVGDRARRASSAPRSASSARASAKAGAGGGVRKARPSGEAAPQSASSSARPARSALAISGGGKAASAALLAAGPEPEAPAGRRPGRRGRGAARPRRG